MGLKLIYDDGQTPLEQEEMDGLKISSITTRADLDEFEQLNIQKAVEFYLLRKRFKTEKILSEDFTYNVHKKMLSDVWAWAGEVRTSEKTIGIQRYRIGVELRQLLDDCRFWIANNTFSDEEISVRFKHKLVAIHIFPNGNGRHSRLMGDIMMKHVFKKPIFTWGQNSLVSKSETRSAYIKALKKADIGEFEDLVSFSQS